MADNAREVGVDPHIDIPETPSSVVLMGGEIAAPASEAKPSER